MAKKFAELLRIDEDRPITKDTDHEFLYNLQNALLLALREQGRLNAMQYRHAKESLMRQRRERARKKLQNQEAE